MTDPKDGFDLLEYPCDYSFKAMCRADADQSAESYIRELVTPSLADGALLSVRSNSSRTGKFESVTFTVSLASREELESIYALVANAERVVMTL